MNLFIILSVVVLGFVHCQPGVKDVSVEAAAEDESMDDDLFGFDDEDDLLENDDGDMEDAVNDEQKSTDDGDKLKDEKEGQMNEMKSMAGEIMDELKKVKKDFDEMKGMYHDGTKRNLDKSTKGRLEEIKENLKDITNDFKDAKAQFLARGNDEMQDESMAKSDYSIDDGTLSFADVKEQLEDTSVAIREMMSEMKGNKLKREQVDKKNMAELNVLKDQVNAVIRRMKDIRQKIKRDSKNPTKRNKNSVNIKAMKDEIHGIDEKLDDMAADRRT